MRNVSNKGNFAALYVDGQKVGKLSRCVRFVPLCCFALLVVVREFITIKSLFCFVLQHTLAVILILYE